jgi:hypothetical protein
MPARREMQGRRGRPPVHKNNFRICFCLSCVGSREWHRNTVRNHTKMFGKLDAEEIEQVLLDQQEQAREDESLSGGSGDDSELEEIRARKAATADVLLFQEMATNGELDEFMYHATPPDSNKDSDEDDDGVDPEWRTDQEAVAATLEEATTAWTSAFLGDDAANNQLPAVVTAILDTACRNNWTNSSTDDLLSTLANKVLPLVFKMNGIDERELDGRFPASYRQALDHIKNYIVDPVEVHFCVQPDCKQIWRDVKDFKVAKACPLCKVPIKKKAATALLRYFPFKDVARLLLAHPVISQYLSCHAEHTESEDGCYRSIWGKITFLPYDTRPPMYIVSNP